MGNSYSSSSTDIIDTIQEIFEENNNNTENENQTNNNNENQTNNNNKNQTNYNNETKNNNKTVKNNNYNKGKNKKTLSETIIDKFLKLEKILRDPEHPFFGPYKPYTEDKPKNYFISFIYYYPKFQENSTDYKKLFPPCFHNEITDNKFTGKEYLEIIKKK